MSSPFEIATRLAPDRVTAHVPDGWQQGKGAFGGVVVGILARAIVLGETDAKRRLRSLAADLVAPAMPGPAKVKLTSIRRGANVSFVDAQLFQNDAVVARASASLASARDVPASNAPAMAAPVLPPWPDVMVIPVGPPLGPVFAQHYEYRSTGPLPFSGGREASAEGWIRERTPPTALDEAAIMGLLDAWWPTIFATSSMPRPATTVGYTMQLLVDPTSLSPEEPLAYRARCAASHDNFFVEMRELWSGETPVAFNQQTFALLA